MPRPIKHRILGPDEKLEAGDELRSLRESGEPIWRRYDALAGRTVRELKDWHVEARRPCVCRIPKCNCETTSRTPSSS